MRTPLFVALLALGATLGCRSVPMIVPDYRQEAFSAPLEEEATVVFLNSRRSNGAAYAAIFDATPAAPRLLGVTRRYVSFAHRFKPGHHRLMIVGESADFLEMELAPGRVYFVENVARFGFMRARYSMFPLSIDVRDQITAKIERCRAWHMTPEAEHFAHRLLHDVADKIDLYFQKWLTKPNRPLIYPGDGFTHEEALYLLSRLRRHSA